MKKLLSIAAVSALVLTGCNKDLKVTPADKLTIEYGDKLDNNKLFDAKKSDKNIKVDKVQDFNAKKVGDQTLKVTFTDGDKTIQKDVKITVKDTKKPEIVLKKDKVTIAAGDKLDLKDNVKSVKDPVDGVLKYSGKEIKKSGYYIDKGKLNTKKAGTYEVIIKAFDANGNKTEKKFKVIVKKKEEAKATTEGQKAETAQNNSNTGQQSQTSSSSTGNQTAGTSGGQGSSTANTGGSSGSNGAQNSSPSQAKPSTPTPAPSAPHITYDGRKQGLPISMQSPIFDDPRAAEAWADQFFGTLDESSPYYNLGYSSCYIGYSDGTEKYSIYWY
ncbi:bacterial Ig-like domain-containing protein [[Clostridium] innocuum]|nr:bacterial Ig-like domain-containing protein [[Clostridium] innocuum]